jgi:hypothetical protein
MLHFPQGREKGWPRGILQEFSPSFLQSKALQDLASQAWQEMPKVGGMGRIKFERGKIMGKVIQDRFCGISLEGMVSQWGVIKYKYTEPKNGWEFYFL